MYQQIINLHLAIKFILYSLSMAVEVTASRWHPDRPSLAVGLELVGSI